MKLRYLLFSISLLAITGCEDFLSTKSYSDITHGNYYKNESDLEGALNASYSFLRSGQRAGNYAEGMNVLGEAGSDEARCTAQANLNSHPLDAYSTLNSANDILSEVWVQTYSAINTTNEIIASIDGFEEPTPRMKGIAGEAKFLQALWYFNLVRNFGGVPVLEDPSRASFDFVSKERDPIEKVFKHIFSLLKYSFENLDDTEYSGQIGRADKVAAAGLLAKAYLHAASSMQLLQPTLSEDIMMEGLNSYSWTDTDDSGQALDAAGTMKYYYQKAAYYAGYVIERHGGEDCFANGSLVGQFYPVESTPDILFEVVMTYGLTPAQSGYFAFMFGPDGKPAHGGGQDIVHPLNCVVIPNYTCSYTNKTWSSADRRFLWTLSTYQYNRTTGKRKELDGKFNTNNCDWIKIHKFSVDVNDIPPISIGAGVNNPILRLSDICLVYAEALGELSYMEGGSISPEALTWLNVVRENAGCRKYDIDDVRTALPIPFHPDFNSIQEGNKEMKGYVTTTDIEHWRRTLMNERMMELLGEGHRWYDLVRLGLLVPVVTEVTAFVNTKSANDSKAHTLERDVKDFNVFRPIPLREIQLHHGNLVQNYGYY
ncbi:MAG: RagB/SusD family nutrient uptake outer membrane protein [Candidatus Cryptobacteroides sp.]